MYVAHIQQKTKKEQTVSEHCRNVGKYSKYLGSKIGIGETARLTGYLHDFGKETKEFDDYIHYSIEHPEERSKKGSVNHSASGAKYIFENYFREDSYQKLTAEMIAISICSHHGGLIDVIGQDGIDEFSKRINPEKEIYFEECSKNFTMNFIDTHQIYQYFGKAKAEVATIIQRMKQEKMADSFTMHLMERYLFSCLIDADRRDTYEFMEGRVLEEVDISVNELWLELSNRLEVAIGKFKKKNQVDVLRGEISDACKNFATYRPGVYRLCVPTGGGKTLSSLRYALKHAAIEPFGKERIFYIIPYISIIEQNAKVIKDILNQNDVILEHHSNLIADNEQEDYRLLSERWSSPIILTTMVQFLDTLFAGGTQAVRRMHNLSNSVIIFDEIQSIPIKCIHMVNSALNFLSKLCNTTVILCTATQPLLSETPKPLQLSSPADIIEDVDEKFRQFKRVNVVDCRVKGGYGTAELADFICDKMKTVENTLVILNTKDSVKQIFNKLHHLNELLPLPEKFCVFHLSTNMCPNHRMEVLDVIKAKLGKERVICVSTPLIEAGVDISFQCVVRATAGFDSIAQAAGRCNRHGDWPCCDVYIVDVKDENLSRLPDILEGKKCTERVLDEFKEKPEAYDGDLLSPKTIKRYYEYYFHIVKQQMDYPIKGDRGTLYDLLSTNTKGMEALEDRTGVPSPYPMKQAFKAAGDNFSVIDTNTQGVIVPYKKGKDLITVINGNCNLQDLKNYLKEAQQYSVNLYANDVNAIGNGIYVLKNGGVLAVEEAFYDENLGVVTEKKAMGLLNV